MAGWTKMPVGMDGGLGPGDFVFDGEPAPPKKAQPPISGPCLLRPNGCMDLDAIWYGRRPQPRRHGVRQGPSPPPQKGGRAPSPIFGPFLLWPNGWMDQDGTWHRDGPWSTAHCARCGPSSPPQKGVEPTAQFLAHFYVAKRLDASRYHLVWR